MTIPWRSVFGNDRPVEVEIGPGHGDVLVALAQARPGTNFFGIEHHLGAAGALCDRIARLRLDNVRVIGADARCVVARLVAPASVGAYHIYFPDPWPKTRHRTRRLFDRAFATALAVTLAPDGRIHLATDLRDLFARAGDALATAAFVPASACLAPPRPRTWFERKYAQAGTYAGSFVRAQPAAACAPGSPNPQKTS